LKGVDNLTDKWGNNKDKTQRHNTENV